MLLSALPQFLPAQDILGTEWRSAAGGRLEFRVLGEPAPQDGTSVWQPLIPELRDMVASEMSAEAQFLAELGPIAILPLFLHGHGGAVGIAEAERRLTKLGIGHTILATQGSWPDDETHDLLRISLLVRSGVAVSGLAMRHFEKSPSRFVRAAAAAAAANDETGRPPRARSEQARLGAVTSIPRGCVLALGVDTAALADIDGLLAAWRHYCRRRASERDMAAGGAVSLDQFAAMQRCMDIPGQLPLEVAAVIGNWRCDYVAVASFGNGAWWLYVGGDFSPDICRRGLRSLGGEIDEGRADAARAVLRGLRVTVTATSLEVEVGDVPVERVGHDPQLLRLSEGVDAWARVGKGEGLQEVGLTGIDVQLRGGVLTGTAAAPVPADVVSAWRRWRANVPSAPTDRLGGLELQELEAIPAGCREEERDRLAWCRLLQTLEIEAKDGEALLRLNLGSLSFIDLVRLLVRWPGKALRLVEELPRGR